MKFKIADKDYEIVAGMSFINQMDKYYAVEDQKGIKFGLGINLGYSYIIQKNPTVLQNFFMSALHHRKDKPSPSEIEQAIVDYAEENNGLDGLFEEVGKLLETSPLTADTVKHFKKTAKID
ncbi:tail assembly chaperone [Shouchella lonarensis]|uniref:Phage tail assembly chaperone protein, TAC n=1 Tax=Shouchella lonarensis TaxID=1464122 RepID=A0A1G6HQ54_9BACI|nr:tail assembly chaperone [Shouchella lonarensis]SDB96324.1 Phage tail assembly chaperone protein, TAC [Shouchella lonarensis]